jgi:hypothetical protein
MGLIMAQSYRIHIELSLPATLPAWQWPASFAASNSERLVEVGLMQRAAADQLQSDFRESALNPNAVMMTPLVLEIIAEKQ